MPWNEMVRWQLAMIITVKSTKRTYRLNLSASDTVGSIKPFLCQADAQALGTTKRLTYKSATLDPQQSLSACKVSDGDVLLLVSSFETNGYVLIKVKHKGQVFEVVCQQGDSVEQLKASCGRRFWLDPTRLELKYGREVMRDDQRLCDFYREGDLEIHIEKKQPSITDGDFEVNVKNLTGKTIPVFINPSMFISEVKGIISEHTNIPRDQLRMIFAGKGLSDKMIVGELGMMSGSTIHLVICMR